MPAILIPEILPAVTILQFLVGKARPFGPQGEPSAIAKRQVMVPLQLTLLGLGGDEQGDSLHHGGPDKALHHYPADHYPRWREDLPQVAADRWRIGAFGENLAPTGLTEARVCIGDIFRLGPALIQVSQIRQPCWKLNVRLGVPDMAQRVQDQTRTGWYYRVLEPGEVTPGVELHLIDRPHPDWSLTRLAYHLYTDTLNRDALQALASLPPLAPSLRQLAAKRLATGAVEDWSRRLWHSSHGETVMGESDRMRKS